MRSFKMNNRGFTMVELLTVIAIIAILAAILFPVFSTAREKARQASCMANMNQIQQSLKMYKLDERVYPEMLVGPVFTNNNGSLMEFSRIQYGFLMKAYVKDHTIFHCPNNTSRSGFDVTPEMNIMRPDPNDDNNRIYGSSTDYYGITYQVNGITAYTYAYESYSVGKECDGSFTEKYSVYRPYKPVENNGAYQSGKTDDMCQMQYSNPPENTIVTWCTSHRNCNGALPAPQSFDLVLLLNGSVKRVDSMDMLARLTGNDPNYSADGNNELWCLK
ncbi:MAG: prepilin-type N-terminal cleavage/methylation domain-containing protein [Armatimonadota bacterium]